MIAADYTQFFVDDIQEFKALAKRDLSWSQRMIQALRNILDKIRGVTRDSQIAGDYGKALKLWEKAYAEAREAVKKAPAGGQGDGSVKNSVNESFDRLIDRWDKNTTGFSFVVGNTSEALKKAGIPDKQIRWDASKIKTILNSHPGMDIETISKIPSLLENPIVVIDSKQNAQAKIVMGDLYDKNGKIVTAIVLLTPTSKKD